MKETLSVMLIDDNEFDLFLMERFLSIKKVSHQTNRFEYASEALEHLEKSDKADWPDLIILDIHMPVMNGFEFLKKYEKISANPHHSTTIIMISSTLDSGDNQKALGNPNVMSLLTKPLNIEELIGILRENKVLV